MKKISGDLSFKHLMSCSRNTMGFRSHNHTARICHNIVHVRAAPQGRECIPLRKFYLYLAICLFYKRHYGSCHIATNASWEAWLITHHKIKSTQTIVPSMFRPILEIRRASPLRQVGGLPNLLTRNISWAKASLSGDSSKTSPGIPTPMTIQ